MLLKEVIEKKRIRKLILHVFRIYIRTNYSSYVQIFYNRRITTRNIILHANRNSNLNQQKENHTFEWRRRREITCRS
jgi:hypothetical protein